MTSQALRTAEMKRSMLFVSRNRQIFENLTDPVAAVHYMEKEPKNLQMDHHKEIGTVDSESLQTNWGEQANLGQS